MNSAVMTMNRMNFRSLAGATTLLTTALWTSCVSALAIDNMVLISGQDPSGDHFTLTGNTSTPVFVRTEITRLHVKDNQVTEEPFRRDNLMSWTITVEPPLFILDPSESRRVTLRPLTDLSSREADEVYAVSFIPQTAKDNATDRHRMDMQVGFQAFYIVPATTTKMNYDLRYHLGSGKVTLVNKGNTVMLAELNRCKAGIKADPKKNCTATFMAIAGKTKEYEVPDWLRGADMTMTVTNHDKSYREKVKPELVR